MDSRRRRSSPAGRRLGGPAVHDSADFRVPMAIEPLRGHHPFDTHQARQNPAVGDLGGALVRHAGRIDPRRPDEATDQELPEELAGLGGFTLERPLPVGEPAADLRPKRAHVEALVRPLESLDVCLLGLELGALSLPSPETVDQAGQRLAAGEEPREARTLPVQPLELLPEPAVPRRGSGGFRRVPIQGRCDGSLDPGRGQNVPLDRRDDLRVPVEPSLGRCSENTAPRHRALRPRVRA
jgi:hypothetical protein